MITFPFIPSVYRVSAFISSESKYRNKQVRVHDGRVRPFSANLLLLLIWWCWGVERRTNFVKLFDSSTRARIAKDAPGKSKTIESDRKSHAKRRKLRRGPHTVRSGPPAGWRAALGVASGHAHRQRSFPEVAQRRRRCANAAGNEPHILRRAFAFAFSLLNGFRVRRPRAYHRPTYFATDQEGLEDVKRGGRRILGRKLLFQNYPRWTRILSQINKLHVFFCKLAQLIMD